MDFHLQKISGAVVYSTYKNKKNQPEFNSPVEVLNYLRTLNLLTELDITKANIGFYDEYIKNIELYQCRLDRVYTSKTYWYLCSFMRSTMQGFSGYKSVFNNVRFYNADLTEASFNECTFINCDFQKTTFHDSDFENCVFDNCSFTEASISKTKMTNCTFIKARFFSTVIKEGNWFVDCNFVHSNYSSNTPELLNIAGVHTNIVPESGSFIGWKRAFMDFKLYEQSRPVIIKLEITEKAERVNAISSRKCRASEVKVLGIYELDGSEIRSSDYDNCLSIRSFFDATFEYRLNETHTPDCEFDGDKMTECASGIHFFLTFNEAVEYSM